MTDAIYTLRRERTGDTAVVPERLVMTVLRDMNCGSEQLAEVDRAILRSGHSAWGIYAGEIVSLCRTRMGDT
jgi:hypothetical protein